jgi:hypothetical protein
MPNEIQETVDDSSEKILSEESFEPETKAIIDGWWRVTGDFLVDVVVAETEAEAGEMFLQLHRLPKETVLQIVPMDCLPQPGTDAIFYPGDMTADKKKLLLKSAVQSIPDWTFRRNQVKA